MDFLSMTFPISGVTASVLPPPLVSLVISFLTSMGGISGAFLLLPFQMSVLNYTTPSVSGTNHVFNIVAIPSGVYHYIKEGATSGHDHCCRHEGNHVDRKAPGKDEEMRGTVVGRQKTGEKEVPRGRIFS